MIFLTSDLHLNNENVIRYCGRPYANAAEMNEGLIENWNSVVGPEDTVYVLGDFIMGNADTVPDILNRLNGDIILIQGNHDTRTKMKYYEELGIKTMQLYHFLYKDKYIIMCYFPINNSDYWKMLVQDNAEIIYCYGHIHDKAPTGYHGDKMYHVGVDTNNYTPISLEQIYREVKQYEREHVV